MLSGKEQKDFKVTLIWEAGVFLPPPFPHILYFFGSIETVLIPQ